MSFAKIKKQNGEAFAKVIRDFHNGIFEVPNIVEILKHAGFEASDAEKNLKYLVSLLSEEKKEEHVVRDPIELLSEAGYDAYVADTLEKQNAIKHHFKSNEELCTFRDHSRYQNYYIINCVKKNVDEIRRENFSNPEREDDYGTSVISIQVAKTGGFISIKNRYNHSVPNCDNTFRSDPDNIIPGLSAAIQKYFNVSFNGKGSSIADGFTLIGDRIFKINHEIAGINIGEIAYIKNGQLIEMGPHEYLFDYIIFDAQTKTFRLVSDEISDCAAEVLNKYYGGSPTLYVKKHCLYDGDEMLLGVWD